MDKTYTITLADGTELENLRLNGNNFISDEEIDSSVFEDNLSAVTITDSDDNEETHQNMVLVHLTQMGDEYWFTLRELTQLEKAVNRITALEESVGDVGSVLDNLFESEE